MDVTSVTKMTYINYDDAVQATLTPRTASERFKKALFVTQMICTQLADVEGEDEFKEILAFDVK